MENITQKEFDFFNENPELTINIPLKIIEIETKIDTILDMLRIIGKSFNIEDDVLFKNNFNENIKKYKKIIN
jgi:hypothetical protein